MYSITWCLLFVLRLRIQLRLLAYIALKTSIQIHHILRLSSAACFNNIIAHLLNTSHWGQSLVPIENITLVAKKLWYLIEVNESFNTTIPTYSRMHSCDYKNNFFESWACIVDFVITVLLIFCWSNVRTVEFLLVMLTDTLAFKSSFSILFVSLLDWLLLRHVEFALLCLRMGASVLLLQ